MPPFIVIFLGCLLAMIALWVFATTVWVPLSRWFAQRAIRTDAPVKSDFMMPMPDFMRSLNATEDLQVAALDATDAADDEIATANLLKAARAYRAALTDEQHQWIRSSVALRRVSHVNRVPPPL